MVEGKCRLKCIILGNFSFSKRPKSLSYIIFKHYVIVHIYRNPDLLSSSSAIAESEGIREEDEFDLEESGSSASSGACTVEEAAYATAAASPKSVD